jgi:hypothetical protein
VVVADQTAFQNAYPSVTNIAAGVFDGSLSNGGERVSLLDPFGTLIQSFTYDDVAPWPTSPDGGGYSLVYIGPLHAGENPGDGAPDDPFDVGTNWTASVNVGGSPGAAEPTGGVLYGDYNQNDVVDTADYIVWRVAVATSSTSLPNDFTPGVVDDSDFTYWRVHFGETLGGGSGAAAVAVEETEAAIPAAVAVPSISEPTPQPAESAAAGLGSSIALVVPSHADFARHEPTFVRRDSPSNESLADGQWKLLLGSLRSHDVRERVDAALGTSGDWHRWHQDDADDVLATAGDQPGDEPSCHVWEDADWLHSLAHRRLS